MVLNGRGNLKFKICDRYELMKVLKSWKYLGLRSKTQRSVFNAIFQKPTIQRRLTRPDLYLLARLVSIFPQWRHEINTNHINIQESLFKLHRSRFDRLITDKINQGITLVQMITSENDRDLPVGINRNTFLSYLIKKRHNFRCQLNNHIPCKLHMGLNREVQSHHIIPLSQGGDDHSSNLIVLCSHHHELVHMNRLEITLINNPSRIQIRYKNKYFNLKPN